MKKYPMYCSWCSTEYFPTIIGYVEHPDSHGVCKQCAELMDAPEGKFRILKVTRDRLEQDLRKTINLLNELNPNLISYNLYFQQRNNLKKVIQPYQNEIENINQIMDRDFGKRI